MKNRRQILYIACAAFFLTPMMQSSEGEKVAVYILGPGRSGTSCAAAVLEIMGLDIGNDLTGPDAQNIKGSFEDKKTQLINVGTGRRLKQLVQADALYDTVRWEKLDKNEKEKLKNNVRDHLYQRFGAKNHFGIKQPCISNLLPLYLPATKELGYSPKLIIVLRNPKEVAASRHKWLGSWEPLQRSFELISVTYHALLKYAHGEEVLIVDFDEFLEEPEKTVNRMQEFLPWLHTYDEVRQEIERFLDRGLKHHNDTKS